MFSRRFLRIKVIKAIYWHFKSESDSIPISEKNLIHSIDKAYDLYFHIFALITGVRRYAQDRIEIARNKKLPTHEDLHPNLRFVENEAVEQIERSAALGEYLKKHALGWERHPEVIKHLYDKMSSSDYYLKYMAAPVSGYRESVGLVRDFYVEAVQDDEMVEAVLEEQSILWSDDLDFALTMMVRTLDGMREHQNELPLMHEYKSEDDREFVMELFCLTVMRFRENQEYIERFTLNWDVERIAFIDNIILNAAMTELTAFDSIPVKVTMDE